MRSLSGRGTASARVRRNPPAHRELKHPFVVLVRRFDPTGEELARWEPLALDADGRPEFFSEARAKVAALNPPRDADLHVGDLVTIVPVDAISDIDNQAHKLFVVTPDGVKAAPKMPKELGKGVAWTKTWAVAPESNAERMVSASCSVDRRRLAMMAADLAEMLLPFAVQHEDLARAAIRDGRQCAFGLSPVPNGFELGQRYRALFEASEVLRKKANSLFLTWRSLVNRSERQKLKAERRAASRIADAIGSATEPLSVLGASGVTGPFSPCWFASSAARCASEHTSSADAVAAVLRWIPLPVLLLSKLGYPDAIPPNLDGMQSAPEPRGNPRRRSGRATRGRR